MLDSHSAKVIQVGDNAPNRVAQACDRCRRKKIRCDGMRPCCTQCANVGFECSTSDKLSRRAFPRGYTESLEEKVRSLQAEVRQCKALLDQRLETDFVKHGAKLESCLGTETCAWPLSSIPEFAEKAVVDEEGKRLREDVAPGSEKTPERRFSVSESRRTSSTMGLIDVLRGRLKNKKTSGANFITSSSAQETKKSPSESNGLPVDQLSSGHLPSPETCRKLLDHYFDEWNPLFPILDRAQVTVCLEGSRSEASSSTDQRLQTLFYLALSLGSAIVKDPNKEDVKSLGSYWRDIISSAIEVDDLTTLQCLLLAQLMCIQTEDTKSLLHYQTSAITLIHRLGTNEAHGAYAIDVASEEKRRTLFRTQFVIQCFTSSSLGLPLLMHVDDIGFEYSSTLENVELDGRTLDAVDNLGQSGYVRAADALFGLARILSAILDNVYTFDGIDEKNTVGRKSVTHRLEVWNRKTDISQFLDRETETVEHGSGKKMPSVLKTMYHYVCALLHRPEAHHYHGEDQILSNAFIDACKGVIQSLRDVENDSLGFAMCLKSDELLLSASIGLVLQSSQSGTSRKAKQENQSLLNAATKSLRTKSPELAAQLQNFGELAKIQSPVKRTFSMASQQDNKSEEANKKIKASKTARPKNKTTFQTKLGSNKLTYTADSISDDFFDNADTKRLLLSSARRISTVRSEPSHSPIRSSPIKPPPLDTRRYSTQTYDVDTSYHPYVGQLSHSSQASASSFLGGPVDESNSLKIDISASQWSHASNGFSAPTVQIVQSPVHDMSTSFTVADSSSFYNAYDSATTPIHALPPTPTPTHANSTSVPLLTSERFGNVHQHSNNNDIHNNPTNTLSSHMMATTGSEGQLMTPTDDFETVVWTPSSLWDGSQQDRMPVSVPTPVLDNPATRVAPTSHPNANPHAQPHPQTYMDVYNTAQYIDASRVYERAEDFHGDATGARDAVSALDLGGPVGGNASVEKYQRMMTAHGYVGSATQ